MPFAPFALVYNDVPPLVFPDMQKRTKPSFSYFCTIVYSYSDSSFFEIRMLVSVYGLIDWVGLSFFFPICHPQDLRILTTFGVTATASGTRTKMNDLWMA